MFKTQNGKLRNGMMEMRRINVGMQGIRWECGCRELAWKYSKSGWKCEKCGESVWQCRVSRWKLKYSGKIEIK